MKQLNTLEDLLVHEIQDLYSAENQLVEALPKVIESVSEPKLRDVIRGHLEETKGQISRLREALTDLGAEKGTVRCRAMEGLIAESEDDIKLPGNARVKDAAIIGGAQRIEHYEIAGYGTAVRLAKDADRPDIARLLSATLEEEKAADVALTRIATGGTENAGLNEKAARS